MRNPFLLFFLYPTALTISSLFVFFENVNNEPYVRFLPYDAVTQVGGSIILMLLWAYLGWEIIRAVVTRQAVPAVLLINVWAILICYHLYECPGGYIGDINDPQNKILTASYYRATPNEINWLNRK